MKYAEILRESKVILEQYEVPLTLRQLFYRLVSKMILSNTTSSYKRLSEIIVKARERGEVEDWRIEDRSREVLGYWDFFNSTEEFLDYQVGQFKSSWQSYLRPIWADQPRYVEVWVEKDALSRLVAEVAIQYRVITCPARGYSSYSYLRRAVERFRGAGKPVVVIYLGDYDPSGLDISRDLHERLLRYGTEGLEVKRAALTLEQIRKYRLPPMPAKASDPRHERFVANTGGTDAVELDALPPDALQQAVRKAIEQEIDADAWNSSLEQEELEREDLRRRLAQAKITWGGEIV